MSADAWYDCPFCKKNVKTAEEQYGKVPVEKFKELLEERIMFRWGCVYAVEDLAKGMKLSYKIDGGKDGMD